MEIKKEADPYKTLIKSNVRIIRKIYKNVKITDTILILKC